MARGLHLFHTREVSDMSTVTLTTGSQIAVPFPPPMTLDSDNPSVLAVTLDRSGATAKAVAAGTAWLTVGIAADLQVKVQVTVQDPTTSASAAKPTAAAPHR
jgi:hypothetical protein